MQPMKLAIVSAIASMVAACGGHQPASVSNGEARVFARPSTEICGLSQADQNWIDANIERGVAAFGWKRPVARAPSCARLRAEIAQLRRATPAPAVQPPPKKKPLWRRVIGR